jgi:hypothetical protein
MATYPSVIGASVQPKQHRKHQRLNQIYGTPQVALTTKSQKRQTKGTNMFKRMIKGLVTWSMSNDRDHREELAISPDHENRISATGIRFEVYRANGGTVIETRRVDRRSGDSLYELHVISGEQHIGEEIGRIITMEALKS